MNVIEELTEIFRKFPGVGPRQAERFVYYLLRQNNEYLNKIARQIPELSNQVKVCSQCQRFFIKYSKSTYDEPSDFSCNICSGKNRDHSTLLIVARDPDLESIEKSGSYNGTYFVLGGVLPILEKEPEKRIRLEKLLNIISQKITDSRYPLSEIIIALNANPEGENTASFIKKEIQKKIDMCTSSNIQKATTNQKIIKISILGRGLSTGTEIEYSDSDTIKSAILNRK